MTRAVVLAALFDRAGRRLVYAIDGKGRGGVIEGPDAKRSDGWRTFAAEWLWAAVAGDSTWTPLPPVPAEAFVEG